MELIVKVVGGCNGKLKYSSVSHVDQFEPLFTLKVPNKLLWKWYQMGNHTKLDKEVIDDLNKSIEQNAIAVKTSSHTVANKLRIAIRKLKYKRDSCLGGRKLKSLMIKTYYLFIQDNDVESFCHLEEAKLWKKLAEENETEVLKLLEDMAKHNILTRSKKKKCY